jgi:hypothetical protein
MFRFPIDQEANFISVRFSVAVGQLPFSAARETAIADCGGWRCSERLPKQEAFLERALVPLSCAVIRPWRSDYVQQRASPKSDRITLASSRGMQNP